MPTLSLETDRTGWTGSFAAVVELVAKDLLSDGAPVNNVSVESDDEGIVNGALTAVEDGHLIVDGQRIEIADNVVGFFVHD